MSMAKSKSRASNAYGSHLATYQGEIIRKSICQ
jgi:hypothetical protein